MISLHSPALIEFRDFKFLITSSPAHFNMNKFIHMLLQYDARILVRACEKTYNDTYICSRGITVEELIIPNGSFPDDFIIQQWSAICKKYFTANPNGAIAVHCESGLGRAPVLVAIALIELGMAPETAVQFIRNKRKGAFNEFQYESLIRYTAHIEKRKKMKKCIVI